MNYYLGIDIGTSGTKAVCFDKYGKVYMDVTKEYELFNPKPSYAEQNPVDWYNAVCGAIKEITSKGYKITGIGLSGQMHGLVLLDEFDNVLRNSIIWCDNRAFKEAEEIKNSFGNERLKDITGNEVVPSFTLSKLLWVKNNEPEIFSKIKKVCLPKDYIRYMLTGSFKTEYSDASGMQMIDIYKKEFSKELLDFFDFDINWMPSLLESKDISGYIKEELCLELGLDSNCFIVGGAGDQAAGAIGNGIIKKYDASIVLGSSGVVFTPIDKDDIKNIKSMQVFMHAICDTYHVMGVTNGCGLSYKWFKENIASNFSYNDLNELAKDAKSNIIYLPYLNGERTPHLDPYASGTFIGIRQNTTIGDMVRAVLEGVGYSLKDCFTLLPSGNYMVRISGGGAKGKLWRSIIASILNTSVERIYQQEGGCLGVAILAMVANEEYASINDACEAIISRMDIEKPDKNMVEVYKKGYEIYKKAYLSLKDYYKIAYEVE